MDRSPEEVAGVWSALEGMAANIADDETRERYLATWRDRYEAEFPRWMRGDDIIRLPDWKHVGEISAQERRRAKKVHEAWLERAWPDIADRDACQRFAWEIGRRTAAGLMTTGAARAELSERLGSMVEQGHIISAHGRGLDGDAGEALLAAIVLDIRCAMHPRSDLGNAMRFRDRHGQDFRHTIGKGWVKWEGKRWRVLDEEKGSTPAEILEAVFDTVSAIQREAFALRATGLAPSSVPEGVDIDKFKVEVDGQKVPVGEIEQPADGMDRLVVTASTVRLYSDALGRFGGQSEDAKRIRCIPDLARRWLTAKFQDFDRDPLAINCQNGTLRLVKHVEREGVRVEAVLSPHRREDLLTRIAAVPYDPDATCPNYDGAIEWSQPKPEMRRYLHQWGGYNLTGDMGAQIFHVWWGPSAQNGKSTLLDAWADCAGDYAEGGKIETFMEAAAAKNGDAATPALARLPGIRMLRTGEPPSGAKFDESLINQITGQDPLLVRDNFRSFFEVKLQIKVTVACNTPPSIPNATEGIKRRVKVVPFEKTMNGALKPDGTPMRDPHFKQKLIPEMPGIFAKLVRGALDWMQHGFVEPTDVTVWTDEYKDENDPLGRFLSYCIVVEDGVRIQSSKMHALFQAWSKATQGPDWSAAHFKKKMVAKGYSTKASNGIQWLGLRAIREVSDFIDSHGNVIDLSCSEATSGGATSARALSAASPPASASENWGDIPDWND